MKRKIILIALLLGMLAISGVAYASLPKGPGGGGPSPTLCGLLPPYIAGQITASAPWYCGINNQVYTIWVNYLPLVLLMLLLAFTIAALIFMVGAAIKSKGIRNFGIGELFEASASAIIVALFLYICAVVFGLIPAVAVGGINPYPTATNLMLNTIGQIEVLYNSAYRVYLVDSYFLSLNVAITIAGENLNEIGIIGFIQSTWRLPLQVFYVSPAATLSGFLIDGIAALYSQYYLLIFFSVAAIPAFLVPGVAFRIFFPTRALGGILMAAGIAFYLVMPTMFAMAYYFTSPGALQQIAFAQSQLSRWGAGTGAEQNGLSSSSPLTLALGAASSAMSSLWLLILFYPALIIAITYVFIVQVSNFIGGATRNMSKLRSFV